jgi:hypothetical protein
MFSVSHLLTSPPSHLPTCINMERLPHFITSPYLPHPHPPPLPNLLPTKTQPSPIMQNPIMTQSGPIQNQLMRKHPPTTMKQYEFQIKYEYESQQLMENFPVNGVVMEIDFYQHLFPPCLQLPERGVQVTVTICVLGNIIFLDSLSCIHLTAWAFR